MATYGNGQVVFSFDDRQLAWVRNAMKKLSPKEQNSATQRGFVKLTAATEAELKNKTLRGQILHVRSGRLRTSIGSKVRRVGGEFFGVVGSGVRSGRRVPYANIHEVGGVIKPKASNKSGFLWIPVRRGSDFAIAQGLSKKRISFSSKVLKYIPVRSVTIPARRYMSRTVSRIERVAVGIMLKEIDATANRA